MDQETYENQLSRVIEELEREPQTMKAVSVKTGIMRENICRYIAHLRKRNKVHALKKGRCPITKYKATFYSCDPDLIPEPGQKEIFESEGFQI